MVSMKNTKNNELAVCGFSAVKVLEKMSFHKIKRFYCTAETAPLFGGLCKKLAAQHLPYNQVDASDLEKLCGSVHHQGVVALIQMPEIPMLTTDIVSRWVAKGESALFLDNIGNVNNVGAIIRSAAFFGIKHIIMPLTSTQAPVSTSMYRIAEGAMEFVTLYLVRSPVRLLRDLDGRMVKIGTALNATLSTRALPELCAGKPFLLILGNEETGMSEAVKKECDALAIIPSGQTGMDIRVDSLNVAQAASVVLYELCTPKNQQRGL